MNKNNIFIIELLRGISAFLVVFGHARAFIFTPYYNLHDSEQTYLVKLLYFITGFGHQAVVVFFVLSGFLIALSIEKNTKFSFSNYFLMRISRLWVVLLPALFFTLLIDSIGRGIDNNGFYLGHLNNIYPLNITDEFSLSSFILNAFFLQGLFCGNFGSNEPLWSLSFEFWYYMMYPFLLFFLRLKKGGMNLKSFSFGVVFMVMLLTLFWLNSKLVVMFGLWLLGAIAFYTAANYQYVMNIFMKLKFFFIVVFIGSLIVVRFKLIDGYIADYFFALAFSLFLLSFIQTKTTNKHLNSAGRFLSNISFSLYLIHFPVLSFVSVYILDNQTLGVSPTSLMTLLTSLLLTVICSWLFYECFESKYYKFKDAISYRKNS